MKAIVGFLFFLFAAHTVHSATLEVSGGQLIGASGVEVDVGGQVVLYDVSFQEGTCGGIFDGCDNAADDFAFSNETAAEAAAEALMAQVFVDVAGGGSSTPTMA